MNVKHAVIHYEGACRYYNLLKEKMRSKGPYNTYHQSKVAQDYVRKLYSDNPLISYDMIEMWLSPTVSVNDPDNDIRYGNLYTFVVLSGIVIPYYEWTYDTSYAGPKYIYRFNPKTNEGRREDIPQELLDSIARSYEKKEGGREINLPSGEKITLYGLSGPELVSDRVQAMMAKMDKIIEKGLKIDELAKF